jgi:hypothetical protein
VWGGLMLFIIAAILGMVWGVAVGGRLSNLLDFRIKKSWIILLAFTLMTITRLLGLRCPQVNDYAIANHILVYALMLICLFFNRHYFGIWFIGTGCLLNAFVMLVNGGKMPVSESSAIKAGIVLDSVNRDIKHILFYKGEDIKLSFLSDIIYLPGVTGIGMRIVSIGDLIVAIGILFIMFGIVRKNKKQVDNI